MSNGDSLKFDTEEFCDSLEWMEPCFRLALEIMREAICEELSLYEPRRNSDLVLEAEELYLLCVVRAYRSWKTALSSGQYDYEDLSREQFALFANLFRAEGEYSIYERLSIGRAAFIPEGQKKYFC